MRIAHVLEFPKSGGSWIRDMVRDYRGVEYKDGPHLARKGEVLQRHSLNSAMYRLPIVVVRDPRDVFVSLYHHETTLSENRERVLDIDRYFSVDPNLDVRANFSRYLKIRLSTPMHPWFSFAEFVRSWTNRADICLVRYEDMVADAHSQLERIIQFIGDPVDLERVDQIVQANTFEAQTRARYGAVRRIGEVAQGTFLRRGGSGDWRNHFTPEACEILWNHASDSMVRLGYERDRAWIDEFARRLTHVAFPRTSNSR